MSRIDIQKNAFILLLEEHGADPMIENNAGILPVEYIHNVALFDPTSVFLLIRSMVPAGGF